MKTKAVLTQQEVQKILTAAREEALKNNWAMAIAIADDGGHLLALERLDDCVPICSYIAMEKARTSALGRRESKAYEDIISDGRNSFMTVPVLSAILEGGVPIIYEGQVIGAIGVSGAKSFQDAQVAKAGASALS
ncbi:heme-binding protein [Entomomonas asaccharolytica]|uniref:Heme-binding protein n=1 Tax=Entomomonas asaccharolytica TaxID=2785331 RepID=A0A974NFK8_9GAMM|nr:heme-binding protein [Entomomonas asaccharolytica]QQP85664.1 heme-binding protein [Entomomonas asaccharolytica]